MANRHDLSWRYLKTVLKKVQVGGSLSEFTALIYGHRDDEGTQILTYDLAVKAFEWVLPSVFDLMAHGLVKRKQMALTIRNPNSGNIFCTCDINREEWEWPYDDIADSKSDLAYRTKGSTRQVQQIRPWEYEEGDTVHAGGYNLEGLPGAASGVEHYFDEMIITWVLAAIKALCMQQMFEKELRMQLDPEHDFFVTTATD